MKKISLLLVLFCMTSCSSRDKIASSDLHAKEIRLSHYKYAVIYDSSNSPFMTSKVEKLMDDHGLKIIGGDSKKQYKTDLIMGVKCREDTIRNGYGNPIGTTLTVSLTDIQSDKALFTVSEQAKYLQRQTAWKEISQKLNTALEVY